MLLEIVDRLELQLAGQDVLGLFHEELAVDLQEPQLGVDREPRLGGRFEIGLGRTIVRLGLGFVELAAPFKPLLGVALGPVHEHVVRDLAGAVLLQVERVLERRVGLLPALGDALPFPVLDQPGGLTGARDGEILDLAEEEHRVVLVRQEVPGQEPVGRRVHRQPVLTAQLGRLVAFGPCSPCDQQQHAETPGKRPAA